MKKLSKIICLITAVASTATVCARPRHVHVQHRHAPHVHYHHHRPIAPIVSGVVGGLIGSAIINSAVRNRPVVVQTSPVVQSTPVVVQGVNTVWNPGHYEDRVQPNGVVVRVWVPGQYVVVP